MLEAYNPNSYVRAIETDKKQSLKRQNPEEEEEEEEEEVALISCKIPPSSNLTLQIDVVEREGDQPYDDHNDPSNISMMVSKRRRTTTTTTTTVLDMPTYSSSTIVRNFLSEAKGRGYLPLSKESLENLATVDWSDQCVLELIEKEPIKDLVNAQVHIFTAGDKQDIFGWGSPVKVKKGNLTFERCLGCIIQLSPIMAYADVRYTKRIYQVNGMEIVQYVLSEEELPQDLPDGLPVEFYGMPRDILKYVVGVARD